MSRFLKALLMRRYLSGGRNYSPYDDDRLIRYQDGSTVDKPIYEQLPIDPEVIASQLNTPIRLNGYYPQNIEAVSPSPAQNVSNGSIVDYIKANSRWGDSSLQARRELGKKYGIYDIGTASGNINLLNKLRGEDGFAPETYIVTSPTSPKKTTKDKKEDENVPPTNKPIEWAGQKFETVQDLADYYMAKRKTNKPIEWAGQKFETVQDLADYYKAKAIERQETSDNVGELNGISTASILAGLGTLGVTAWQLSREGNYKMAEELLKSKGFSNLQSKAIIKSLANTDLRTGKLKKGVAAKIKFKEKLANAPEGISAKEMESAMKRFAKSAPREGIPERAGRALGRVLMKYFGK